VSDSMTGPIPGGGRPDHRQTKGRAGRATRYHGDGRTAGRRPGGAGGRARLRLPRRPRDRAVRPPGRLAHRGGPPARRARGQRHGRGPRPPDRRTGRPARARPLDRQPRRDGPDGGQAGLLADGRDHGGQRTRGVRRARALPAGPRRLRRPLVVEGARRGHEGTLGAPAARRDGPDAPVGVQTRRRRAARSHGRRPRRGGRHRRGARGPDPAGLGRTGSDPDLGVVADRRGRRGRRRGARGG